jgi:hypothetical protein
MKTTLALLMILGLGALGCSNSTARAGVRFAALASPSTASRVRPLVDAGKPTLEYFKMRFLSVYLEQDMTPDQNPVGVSPMLYLNPECQGDNDTGHCNLEGSGAVHEVKQYFDFTDSAAVNLAINGQAQLIPAGDYKYVSLDFCVGTPSEPNVEFQLTGGAPRTAKSGVCGVHSVEAKPPIHVDAGGQVTVTLAYDLQAWLTPGDGTGGNGYDGANLCDLTATIMPRPPTETGAPGSVGWCVGAAQFVPSFAAQ